MKTLRSRSIIVDSNLLADNREYPFNKDTQNDVNIKGAIFKDGRYFEVEENGTLNPAILTIPLKRKLATKYLFLLTVPR